MANAHDVTGNISAFMRDATNHDVHEMVLTGFSLMRNGLAHTGRMKYDWDDPVYVALNKAESELRSAMKILMDTAPDPVKWRKQAERAMR